MNRKDQLRTWLVGLVTIMVMFGCSSKSTLDTSEVSGSNTLQVSATPTSINANESTVIEATVMSGTDPVEGQAVHFTVSPAGAGSLTPEYDTTGANGTAAAIYVGTLIGSVTITAEVEGTSLASTVGVMVNRDESAGLGSVTVSASEGLLIANGSDTSLITIVVRDALGQAAPVGTLIKIAAGEKFNDIDTNGYFGAYVDKLIFDANGNGQWDGFGQIPATATIADTTGAVVVAYVSGFEAYTSYIKVTVMDAGIEAISEISIQLNPDAVLGSIYMSSDSMSLSVTQTGGIETALLRATGYDVNGNAVPEGVEIVFAILDGPGGGEALDSLGPAIGPDTVFTNANGVASVALHAGTISGTVRIRAYSGTIMSNATQILIAAGPPQNLVVGPEECNVPYWDHVGDSVKVVAVVSDVYNNPVNDSTVVYFTTDEGTIMSHQVRTSMGKGISTTAWIAGTNPPADGIVWIYAETAGGTVSDSSMFFNSYVPAALSVTGWQTTINADGSFKFYATLQALDLNGNFVVDGTNYKGEAMYLGVADGQFADGCFSSTDRLEVLSTSLTVDGSITGANDDGVGAIDNVTYWTSSGASITLACSLLTDFSYSGTSSISGAATAQPGEAIRLSAIIADRSGNPLGDHTLNMTAANGVVTGATQETDRYGEAGGFIWTAPALDGDYNINVTDTDPRGGGLILTHKISVKAAT